MTYHNLTATIERLTGHNLTEPETFKILNAIEDDEIEMERIRKEQRDQQNQNKLNHILNTVALFHDIEPDMLKVKRRNRVIVEPRQLCFALIMFGLKMSCERVGEQMGQFDHVTVLYGIGKVSERYQAYKHYRSHVDEIIAILFSSDEIQQHIKARIIDPHLDRKHSYAKLETA